LGGMIKLGFYRTWGNRHVKQSVRLRRPAHHRREKIRTVGEAVALVADSTRTPSRCP
jgi:hypothetical protein